MPRGDLAGRAPIKPVFGVQGFGVWGLGFFFQLQEAQDMGTIRLHADILTMQSSATTCPRPIHSQTEVSYRQSYVDRAFKGRFLSGPIIP